MKRSAQVMLVVMSAAGLGAGAYALMPPEDCSQYQSDPARYNACQDRRGGSSHSSSSSHGSSNSSSSSSHSSSSNSSSSGSSSHTALLGSTQRGGFGGFSSHFSGGG